MGIHDYYLVMYEKLFDRGGLSLERLRRFLSVVDAGGNTKAAGGDPVLQSQISRQIKELEGFFEVQLFRRAGRKMEPTVHGKLLATIARESLGALEDFRKDCSGDPLGFSIGSGDAFFQWVLLPRLEKLKLGTTSLHLENLRTMEVVERVTDMRLDFGVVRESAVTRSHQHQSLGKLRYSLFVPRHLMSVSKRPAWKTILGKFPLATLESSGEFFETLKEAAGKEQIDLQVRLACSSFPQAAKALETGQFIAILPKVAEIELPKGEFLQIPVPFLESHVRELHLIWNARQMTMRPEAERLRVKLKKLLSI